MIKQKPVYVCDVCGKEIDNGPYSLQLVKLKYDELHANGWNEWSEQKEKHVHKSCLKDFKFM